MMYALDAHTRTANCRRTESEFIRYKYPTTMVRVYDVPAMYFC